MKRKCLSTCKQQAVVIIFIMFSMKCKTIGSLACRRGYIPALERRGAHTVAVQHSWPVFSACILARAADWPQKAYTWDWSACLAARPFFLQHQTAESIQITFALYFKYQIVGWLYEFNVVTWLWCGARKQHLTQTMYHDDVEQSVSARYVCFTSICVSHIVTCRVIHDISLWLTCSVSCGQCVQA